MPFCVATVVAFAWNGISFIIESDIHGEARQRDSVRDREGGGGSVMKGKMENSSRRHKDIGEERQKRNESRGRQIVKETGEEAERQEQG